MAPPPPPPSELIDDAIAEILVRLPPDDPACLVRASLVCKLWRRILSDPTFPHRYREFHRTPPLLGFVCGTYTKSSRFVNIAKGVPFLRPPFGRRAWALDCRHGRVLFDWVGAKRESLAVWDPVTGDHKLFADPDPDSYDRSGVVLCAAAGCNHRACHGGPFVVVLVSSLVGGTKDIAAWVYTRPIATLNLKHGERRPPCSCLQNTACGQNVVPLLETKSTSSLSHLPVLMTMEDGSLGLADINDSTLHLWARKVNLDGSMGWVQDRVVSLNNLVPIITRTGYTSMNAIALAEGVDFLLLGSDGGGYMLELISASGRFKKRSNPEYRYYDAFPYLSFYIPACARGALSSTVGTQ